MVEHSLEGAQYYYPREEPVYNETVHTPIKDLPPTLGFGSSSSPFFESPATVGKHAQFMQWSPSSQEMMKAKLRSATSSSSHLLPSQFPPTGFSGLESSPPDVGRQWTSNLSYDQGASPKPSQIKRVGRRGRPRKYDLKDEHDVVSTQGRTSSSMIPTDMMNSLEPSVEKQRSQIARTQRMQNSSDSNMYSIAAESGLTSKRKSPSYSPNLETANSSIRKKARIEQQQQQQQQQQSLGQEPSDEMPLYANKPTSNGVPLFSSKIFELACKNQSDITSPQASALRGALAEREEKQRQFSTKGLRFNFSINLGGKASIDMTTPLSPDSPSRYKNVMKETSANLALASQALKDEDSESEVELINSGPTPITTPPRFSSLGSSDAAAAFAKTLARTNDQGNGFMFLFPPVSTPDKHGQLTSFVPCTPRTPRMLAPFDENSFSMQMQTPPGAIYSYDNPSGMYGTGMTPFIGSARGLN